MISLTINGDELIVLFHVSSSIEQNENHHYQYHEINNNSHRDSVKSENLYDDVHYSNSTFSFMLTPSINFVKQCIILTVKTLSMELKMS